MYHVFPTPEHWIQYINKMLRFERASRQYWTISVGDKHFHGLVSKDQAEYLGEQLTDYRFED